eukprot:6552827-Prymnesium_polylepis.1
MQVVLRIEQHDAADATLLAVSGSRVRHLLWRVTPLLRIARQVAKVRLNPPVTFDAQMHRCPTHACT